MLKATLKRYRDNEDLKDAKVRKIVAPTTVSVGFVLEPYSMKGSVTQKTERTNSLSRIILEEKSEFVLS